MTLTQFLSDLYQKGEVTVAGEIFDFEAADMQQSATVLHLFYKEDALEMPFNAPAFAPSAALWAAQYLYHAAQLILLRNLDETVVERLLTDFSEPISPEVVYSIDLTFRYLPDLLHMAKGLSPDDVLVKCLKKTMNDWVFSAVGVKNTVTPVRDDDESVKGVSDVSRAVEKTILQHQSLKYAYVERIIAAKDLKKAENATIRELIDAVLGTYTATYWKELTNNG